MHWGQGEYDLQWSQPFPPGAALAVPHQLPCYVSFGQARVVQTNPSTFIAIHVRRVDRPVVVALKLDDVGAGAETRAESNPSYPFEFEFGASSTGTDSSYFDSTGYSVKPTHGC